MNTILIVDDNINDLEVLTDALNRKGYEIRSIENGITALKVAESIIPDLILLDTKTSDLDGYQVCQRLKSNLPTKDIPVIFTSASDEASDKAKAFEVGGVDYLIKPFTLLEAIAKLENNLAIGKAKAQIGQFDRALAEKVAERTLELTLANQNLAATNQQLQQKIWQWQQAQERLIQNALYDSLTGLPNRTLLLERIDRALERSKRNPGYLFAILFIDLDRLKIVNDSWGHLVGDKLLVAAAQLLSEDIRSVDTVARLGGDEFVILLGDINSLMDATLVGDRLLEKFEKAFNIDDRAVYAGASIGITLNSPGYESSIEILRDADAAMYRAKEKGKGRYEVFDRQMHLQTLETIELEHDLRLALTNREFSLCYQPIVALDDCSIIGFEALIRWQHPTRGWISPSKFIPIATNAGLIVSIGDWVLARTCQQLANWQKKYADIPKIANLVVSINVASQQVAEPNYIKKLDRILVETGINPSCLQLEIAESMLSDPNINIQQTLLQIKRRNIKLSIDDFGTGYSSLSCLHRLSIDTLKIDRSFIKIDRGGREIVNTIITLARTLKIKAIAEGVETRQQLQQLKMLGCKFVQGYFFAEPLKAQAVELTIERNFAIEKQKC